MLEWSPCTYEECKITSLQKGERISLGGSNNPFATMKKGYQTNSVPNPHGHCLSFELFQKHSSIYKATNQQLGRNERTLSHTSESITSFQACKNGQSKLETQAPLWSALPEIKYFLK